MFCLRSVRCNFAVVSLLFVNLSTPAGAATLKLDITYSNGQIVSGPLSADLTELPESVLASFIVDGSAEDGFGIADVVEASLAFGDVTWNASDLESFSTTLTTDGDERFVVALTYEFAPKSTSAVNDRIAGNFPLEITGTTASGEDFHYLYDRSMQTVTEVPEPTTIGLALLALLGLASRWRRGFDWPSHVFVLLAGASGEAGQNSACQHVVNA